MIMKIEDLTSPITEKQQTVLKKHYPLITFKDKLSFIEHIKEKWLDGRRDIIKTASIANECELQECITFLTEQFVGFVNTKKDELGLFTYWDKPYTADNKTSMVLLDNLSRIEPVDSLFSPVKKIDKDNLTNRFIAQKINSKNFEVYFSLLEKKYVHPIPNLYTTLKNNRAFPSNVPGLNFLICIIKMEKSNEALTHFLTLYNTAILSNPYINGMKLKSLYQEVQNGIYEEDLRREVSNICNPKDNIVSVKKEFIISLDIEKINTLRVKFKDQRDEQGSDLIIALCDAILSCKNDELPFCDTYVNPHFEFHKLTDMLGIHHSDKKGKLLLANIAKNFTFTYNSDVDKEKTSQIFTRFFNESLTYQVKDNKNLFKSLLHSIILEDSLDNTQPAKSRMKI